MKFLIMMLVVWQFQFGPSLLEQSLFAADWPTYKSNPSRNGHTSEALPNQLYLRWSLKMEHAPQPAWILTERMQFDFAFQPIVMGDTVYWGSSADDTVYAVDLETGIIRWTFTTAGPVRFAPVGWRDRLFVVSDDGWLYAISSKEGKLLWKKRGGLNDRKIMGNDRLISRWPARGGPVVYNHTVYFAAGIWQSDGVYLHALDADTGKILWSNRSSGGLNIPQPHSGAVAKSGVSPQGYLLADEKHIYVPTGRAVPAVFHRQDGRLAYYHLQKNQHRGGSDAMLAHNYLFNAGCLFDKQQGEFFAHFGLGAMAATTKNVLRAEGKSLAEYRWQSELRLDRKGKSHKTDVLNKTRLVRCPNEVIELIIAGNDVIIGENGRVAAIDYTWQQNVWWKHEVNGAVRGMAFANGRLIISTNSGWIYCFDGQKKKAVQNFSNQHTQPAAPNEIVNLAADEIVKNTGISEGICVDVHCGTGELAIELARRTKLHIYGLESDENLVKEARTKISAAGLYGSRITIHHLPDGLSNYPTRFANLVTSSRSLYEPVKVSDLKEMQRIQKPYGGIICRGPVGRMKIDKKGALKGAGSWTHLYANAANTVCSDDKLIKGPLEMCWFRDVDFEIPDRHGRGPAPLYHQGVMVVAGVHGLCALDAYNGRTLWKYKHKNVMREYNSILPDVAVSETGTVFCLGDDSIFLKTDNRCLQIEIHSGKVVSEFSTPVPKNVTNQTWGYLAYRAGILYGTVANEEHTVSRRYQQSRLFPESVLLFAYKVKTGELIWKHKPEHSIRNNSIAIGRHSAFLIDRPLAIQDRIQNPRRGLKPPVKMKPGEQPGGKLISLDVTTGKINWKNSRDIFGTVLSVSDQLDVLLMSYQAVNHGFFSLPSEVGGRIAGIHTETGKRLWDKKARYKTRPLINGTNIYTQEGAWYLKTGEPIPFKLRRSYGCGQISASSHMMLFRSGTLGYLDLTRDAGVENYGGIRLGCYINAIPAGGLVLVPDGSAKCRCSYQMKAWFALQQRK